MVRQIRQDVDEEWVKNGRDKTELEESRKRENGWWWTEDLMLAARLFQVNLMIIESHMVSWETGIATGWFGGAEDEIIRIFGGSKFQGGHWVLLTECTLNATEKLWGTGIRRRGTLEDVWRSIGVNHEQIPMEIHQNENQEMAMEGLESSQ